MGFNGESWDDDAVCEEADLMVPKNPRPYNPAVVIDPVNGGAGKAPNNGAEVVSVYLVAERRRR